MNTGMKSMMVTVAVFSLPAISFTQSASPASTTAPIPVTQTSPFQEPVFYVMCLVAFILLVFIMNLSKLLSAVAKNFSKNGSSGFKALVLLFTLSMLSLSGNAQATGQSTVLRFFKEGFGHNAYNALAVIIIIELLVVLYYARMIRLFLVKEKEPAPYMQKQTKPFWDKFNKSVAIETEAAILTDHEYDGIRELDNALPPWWKYGFYLTIVFAIVYLAHFHVFGTGNLQLDELKLAEEKEALRMEEVRKNNANMVDETTVKFLDNPSDLVAGQSLFTEKTCIACHGQQGQGGTGPNLTDDYWLHGGSIGNIFKTIKFGVPDKGMIAWGNQITPLQMAQLASYIKSMHGSNPPNPKEPQGDLWSEGAVSDTLVVVPDSLQVSTNLPDSAIAK